MIRSIFSFFGIVLFLFACQPTPSEEELNQDLVVQTDYDESVNFGGYSTFTLPLDTIGLISNNINDSLIIGDFAKEITTKIKLNMESRGYSYVTIDQNPDLSVNAFIVNDFNVFQTIRYPSYGGGYYSPYYGYYFPIVQTYATNSAILILQIVDLNKKNAQNQFSVIWISYIGDIVSSVDPFQKSIEAIDQAFVQSPVIGK